MRSCEGRSRCVGPIHCRGVVLEVEVADWMCAGCEDLSRVCNLCGGKSRRVGDESLRRGVWMSM